MKTGYFVLQKLFFYFSKLFCVILLMGLGIVTIYGSYIYASNILGSNIALLSLSAGLFFVIFILNWMIPLISGWLERLGEKKAFLILIVISVLVKALYLLFIKVDSSLLNGDIEVYFRMIQSIVNGEEVYSTLYALRAPHVFFFSLVMSVFARVFGCSIQSLNFVLCLLMSFASINLYTAFKKIANYKIAFISSMLFVLIPSQLLLSQLLIHEVLFIFLHSLILNIVVYAAGYSGKKGIVMFSILGILLGLASKINSFGLISMIATMLYFLFSKNELKRNLVIILNILFFYLLITSGLRQLQIQMCGGIPSDHSFGMGLYIGSNFETSGFFNSADGEKIEQILAIESHYTDAVAFQKIGIRLAIERYMELLKEPVKLLTLFIRKFDIAWRGDAYPFALLSGKFPNILAVGLLMISHVIYFTSGILGGLGLILSKFENESCFYIELFLTGMFLILLLSEVMNKYHMPATCFILFLGVYYGKYVFGYINKLKVRKQK